VASDGTGAPHEGQFMVSGLVGMLSLYYMGRRFFARQSERGTRSA
jgi:hypothetical protein